MNLKEFLLKNGLSKKDFAIKIGVTPETLSRIIAGSQKPSKRLLTFIEMYTDKEVRAEDVLGPGILGNEKII